MAATRLLRMSKPIGQGLSHDVQIVSRPSTVMCLNKAGLNSENPPCSGIERKPMAAKASTCVSPSVLVSEPKTDKCLDLGLLLAYVADAMSHLMKIVTKQRPWRLNIQMYLEKAIVDCRFFTLLAVAGSLLGSVLCFVEGCALVLESYFKYFHAISQMSEQGHVMFLLLEAIDMFLVGTAMLTFAMALHVMFVGQQNINSKRSHNSTFSLEKLSSLMGMGCAMQAKSKMGHAVIMILQVQVLEKLKGIPVSNGVDIALFAGAVFLSSASIFVLSRMAVASAEAKR